MTSTGHENSAYGTAFGHEVRYIFDTDANAQGGPMTEVARASPSTDYFPWLLSKLDGTVKKVNLDVTDEIVAYHALKTLRQSLKDFRTRNTDDVNEARCKSMNTLYGLVHKSARSYSDTRYGTSADCRLTADQTDAHALLEAISLNMSNVKVPICTPSLWNKAHQMLKSAETASFVERKFLPCLSRVTLTLGFVAGGLKVALPAALVVDLATSRYYGCNSVLGAAMRSARSLSQSVLIAFAFEKLDRTIEESCSWKETKRFEALSETLAALHKIIHNNAKSLVDIVLNPTVPATMSADQINAYALLEAISWTISDNRRQISVDRGRISHRARLTLNQAKTGTRVGKYVIPALETVTLAGGYLTDHFALALLSAAASECAISHDYECDGPLQAGLRKVCSLAGSLIRLNEETEGPEEVPKQD